MLDLFALVGIVTVLVIAGLVWALATLAETHREDDTVDQLIRDRGYTYRPGMGPGSYDYGQVRAAAERANERRARRLAIETTPITPERPSLVRKGAA